MKRPCRRGMREHKHKCTKAPRLHDDLTTRDMRPNHTIGLVPPWRLDHTRASRQDIHSTRVPGSPGEPVDGPIPPQLTKKKHSALQQSCFFSFFFWASLLLSFCALSFFSFFAFFQFFCFCLFVVFLCPSFPLPLPFFFACFCIFFVFRPSLLSEDSTPWRAWHPCTGTDDCIPPRQGGLGLRTLFGCMVQAHWSSWADCSKMVQTPSSSVWQHRCIIEAIRDQETLSPGWPLYFSQQCIQCDCSQSVQQIERRIQ